MERRPHFLSRSRLSTALRHRSGTLAYQMNTSADTTEARRSIRADVPSDFYAEVKRIAERENRSVAGLTRHVLREHLDAAESTRTTAPVGGNSAHRAASQSKERQP